MYQTKLNKASFGQNIVNVLPRGFGRAASLQSSLTVEAQSMLRLTADYAIPIYIGDISLLKNFLYIKRLTVTPHFDYTFINGKYSLEGLWSAGANVGFDLESVAWIAWPCSVGVTMSYNGGPSYSTYDEIHNIGRFYAGPTFNVSF